MLPCYQLPIANPPGPQRQMRALGLAGSKPATLVPHAAGAISNPAGGKNKTRVEKKPAAEPSRRSKRSRGEVCFPSTAPVLPEHDPAYARLLRGVKPLP